MSQIFNARYEFDSIERGMQDDLATPVGQTVNWYLFNAAGSELDDVYDVGADFYPGGRRWYPPLPLPVINSMRTEGAKEWTDGLYTADTIHLVMSSTQAQRNAMPNLTANWQSHLRDRIVFHGAVFTPTRIELRGIIEDSYTVIGVDAIQVNPEELVNDPDFARYAN